MKFHARYPRNRIQISHSTRLPTWIDELDGIAIGIAYKNLPSPASHRLEFNPRGLEFSLDALIIVDLKSDVRGEGGERRRRGASIHTVGDLNQMELNGTRLIPHAWNPKIRPRDLTQTQQVGVKGF